MTTTFKPNPLLDRFQRELFGDVMRQVPPALRTHLSTKPSLPPLHLLTPHEKLMPRADVPEETLMMKNAITAALAYFGLSAEVSLLGRSERLTSFTLQPQLVIKSQRPAKIGDILSISKDLALKLQKPIELKFEPSIPALILNVPTGKSATVRLRTLVSLDAFRKINEQEGLAIALGSTPTGPLIADLTQMPHLLIAGATGSGKSVCLNSILASLLFSHPPESLKLLLIDPKRVEMSAYRGLPHLKGPIITEMDRARGAIAGVVSEMERRYDLLAQAGKRELVSYNASGRLPLPRLVVVIDELADLMLTHGEEIEEHLVRLAQMARATGIHLLIATQRPTVNVVTGLLKANLPTRIAFAVATSTDSRVILDAAGAEKLLGRGDGLFAAPDSLGTQRFQGVWVEDDELTRLLDFWRLRPKNTSHNEAIKLIPGAPSTAHLLPAPVQTAGQNEDTSLIRRARAIGQEEGRISITLLQRRLRISYLKAAQLVERLRGPLSG